MPPNEQRSRRPEEQRPRRFDDPESTNTFISISATLADLFDRSMVGYYASIDDQDWTSAFEFRVLIDHIHQLAEDLAEREAAA